MKLVEILMRENLPRKDVFMAAEVADLLKVQPHEMRYWETEFPQVRARKSKSGQRIYLKKDVVLFFAIKSLLHEKKLTIAAAQRILAQADEYFYTNAHEQDGVQVEEKKLSCDAGVEMLSTNHALSDGVLATASQLLKSDNTDKEFDDLTQHIYHHCADDLEGVHVKIEPQHVGEMIHDAIAKKEISKKPRRLSKLDYEKALAVLIASKQSLTDLLGALDKYRASTWWNEFKP